MIYIKKKKNLITKIPSQSSEKLFEYEHGDAFSGRSPTNRNKLCTR